MVEGPATSSIRADLKRELPSLPAASADALAGLVERAPAVATLEARIDLLYDLVGWLRGREGFDLPVDAPITGSSPSARLWVLWKLCTVNGQARASLSALIEGALPPGATVNLLVHGGLARDAKLLGELGDRLVRVMLPQPPTGGDLAALLPRLFPDRRSTEWFEHAPPRVMEDVFHLLVSGSLRARLIDDLVQAIVLLSVRTSSLGLDDDARSRGPSVRPSESPFLALPGLALELANALHHSGGLAATQHSTAAMIARARAAHGQVVAHIDRGGISVDLVYRVELLSRTLTRLERLVWLLDRGPEDGPAAVRLMRDLVRANLSDRSMVFLVRENSTLLARRIIERAGETGEHYITTTRKEWREMLRSAAGGGVLTAGTTLFKVAISRAHMAPFFEFLGMWANYAGSFLVMQGFHFTLATKQPSMTAATLAKELGEGVDQVDALAELVARTARSQFAAAVGNLGAVIPTILVVGVAWSAATGAPWLDHEKAHHIVESLHPWHSATIFYAVLTAGLLWLASVMAGAVENWTALHRIPEAIACHRGLRRVLGAQRTEALGHGFAHNISGIAGNISLGFLLAAMPVAGVFFGAPLDVRHVTLSTGSLTLAGASLGFEGVLTAEMALAAVGIVIVALLNFGVSFLLALSVAARARSIPFAQVWKAGRVVVWRLIRRPLSLLYPPPDPTETPTVT